MTDNLEIQNNGENLAKKTLKENLKTISNRGKRSMSNRSSCVLLDQKRMKIIENPSEMFGINTSKIHIESEVKKELMKKMEENEMNSIKFYDIMQIGENKKKKGASNFRSKRYASDLALVRGTKFFTNIEYNDYEKGILNDLKKSPGKRLMMNEM